MDIWVLLGIEKTEDTRLIKKAYAKMLKIYNPEDDPESFIKLRRAYEEALKEAGDGDNNKNFKKPDFDNYNDTDIYFEEPIIMQNEGNYPCQKSKEVLLEKVGQLYNDIFKRRDINCWQNLFSEMSIDEYQCLSEKAWNFFNLNCHLPYEVWKLIDAEFSIFEDERFRWSKFVKFDYGLSFDCFDPKLKIDYPSYAHFRFLALVHFISGDYKETIDFAQQAENIFNKDFIIYRLKGISFYFLRYYGESVEALSQALSLNSKDLDLLLYRGNSLTRKGDLEKASIDFYTVLEIDKENIEGYKGMVKCLYSQNKLKLGDRYYGYFLNRYPQVDRDLEMDVWTFKRESMRISSKLQPIFNIIIFGINKLKNPDSFLSVCFLVIVLIVVLCATFALFVSPIGIVVFILLVALYIKKQFSK